MTNDERTDLAVAMAQMETRIVREIYTVRDMIVSEDRVRDIAREEVSTITRLKWSLRASMAGVGVLAISISTFAMTVIRFG